MFVVSTFLILVNIAATFAEDGNVVKAYHVSTNIKLPYVQAMRFCNNLNMSLVTINSDDNQLLWELLKDRNDNFWSSGTKLIDNTWLWLSTGQPINVTNWDKGEPSGNNEYCISLKVDSRNNIFWNDDNCYSEKHFVCESTKRGNGLENEQSVWSNIFESSERKIQDAFTFENKHFYVARKYRGTFWQSLQFCEIIGMKSVSILSEEENQRVHKHLEDTNAESIWWTSGTRTTDGFNWFWLSNHLLINYARWGSGEPNNENKVEQCLSLSWDSLQGLFLNDLPCLHTAPVICEKPVNDKQNRRTRSADLLVENPKHDDCEQSVINIHINNNVAANENQDFLPIRIDDQSSESGHSILIDNKWDTCKK